MANSDRATVQSGLDDLLGSVIRSDRQKAGRAHRETSLQTPETEPVPDHIPAPSDYDKHTSHIVIQDYDNMTDTQTGMHADGLTPVQPDKRTATPKKRTTTPSAPSADASAPSLAPKRCEEAAAMAATNTMTVTLRIPAALNEWLDEYVHRSWPNKVKKQELVIEALQLLFVRRGRPGEEIIETDLLPSKK